MPARAEVVHTTDKMRAIVRAVVPEYVIRARTPLKPTSLLPIPCSRFAYFCPLIVFLPIDEANLALVRFRDFATLIVTRMANA